VIVLRWMVTIRVVGYGRGDRYGFNTVDFVTLT